LEEPATYVFRAVNDGRVVYALETEGERIEDKTPNILPDESTQLKVNLNPGTYVLYRPVGDHKGHGMNGTVMVREG
jgi:hypothetical protein